MKAYLIISNLIWIMVIFFGFLVGLLLSKSTIYYLEYLLIISIILLFIFLKKNYKFTFYQDNAVSNKNKVVLFLQEKMENKFGFNGITYYFFKLFIYWLSFFYLSLWFFANLIKFGYLNSKIIVLTPYKFAFILKAHVFEIMLLPLSLFIPLVITYAFFSYKQKKNPFWNEIIITKIKNKLMLFFNAAIIIAMEACKFFYVIFILAMFCLIWLNYLAKIFGISHITESFLLSSVSMSIIGFSLYYLFLKCKKKIISKKPSLALLLMFSITVTIIFSLVFYSLQIFFNINNHLNESPSISLLNFVEFDINSRVFVILLSWMVVCLFEFASMVASISYNRTTRQIVYANILIVLIFSLLVKISDINTLKLLIGLLSSFLSDVIASILIIFCIFCFYGNVRSYADYISGSLPVYGKKRRIKHIYEVASKLLPIIPFYTGILIFFGWHMVQIILAGAAFIMTPLILLFIFFGLSKYLSYQINESISLTDIHKI